MGVRSPLGAVGHEYRMFEEALPLRTKGGREMVTGSCGLGETWDGYVEPAVGKNKSEAISRRRAPSLDAVELDSVL